MSTADDRDLARIGEEFTGKCVRWVDGERPYGWLRAPGLSRDVFVPRRTLRGCADLQRDDVVRFVLAMGRDGRLHADAVELSEPVQTGLWP